MTDKMTAAALREHYASTGKTGPTDRRIDREGPIHKAIIDLCQWLLHPDVIWHHSPNEVDLAGSDVARAIAKARSLGTRKGWPDLEFLNHGLAHFMEVKAPGNDLSQDQRTCHDALRRAGCKVATVWSVEEAHAQIVLWRLA